MFVLVDGAETASVPITDSAVLRGDGCFESIRSYAGVPFALAPHLDRLERSAEALRIPLPARRYLEEWCRCAASRGDGVVRLVVTRGDLASAHEPTPRCIVLWFPLPTRKPSLTLLPVTAPWHPAGRDSELAGAKTLSYAPHLAAGRTAESEGFDDALLVSDDGTVLEGPTFSVAWVAEGRLETASLDLFILDSITRRLVLDAARRRSIPIVEGRFAIRRLDSATEVMALSTVKEVTPVTRVGGSRFEPGPVTKTLAGQLLGRVAEETGQQARAGR